MSHSPTLAPGNQVQFAPLVDGVTLMRAAFTDHVFERHSHDCFTIGVTVQGIQRFRCKGQRHDSRPGEIVLFNPDEDHDGQRGDSDGFQYATWSLDKAFFLDCLDLDAGLAGTPYFTAPHVRDPALAAAFTQMTLALLETPRESLRAEVLLRGFVGRLLARHGEQVQETPLRAAGSAGLLRVKAYISAHFQQALTVTELASVAGLSRAHFTRAYTQAFHTPPHVYLNAVRIGHAQILLRGGMPLADVANACGFADQSHFARRFKGAIGVSPSAWR